jgi:hypothetical protein
MSAASTLFAHGNTSTTSRLVSRPVGCGGQRYWDGTAWRHAIPASKPARTNWPLLAAIGAAILLVFIVVGVWAGGSDSDQDSAYIHALTTGPGMRADPNWVNGRDRGQLISAGHYLCDRLRAGVGLISAEKQTMDRFDLPTGLEVAAVSNATTEVYYTRRGLDRAQ